MTRDTKLALVVGFALVLAVGVLISDHFASGYRTPPADLVEQPARPEARDLVRSAGEAVAPRVREHRVLPTGPVELRLGTRPDADGVSTPRSAPRGLLPHELAARESRLVLPLADVEIRPRGEPDKSVAPGGASSGPDHAVSERWHVVVSGESLWTIAERYYGTGSASGGLARANADRVSKSGMVRVGVRLRIPAPEALGLKGKLPAEVAHETPAPRGPGSHKRSLTLTGGTHTVRKNETLSEIASRELGRSTRMGEIVALNRDQISDPDEIRAGMVLRLPKK